MRTPRTPSRSVLPAPISSSEPKVARPLTRPLLATKPRVARNAWLFPAPDSPTTATHSPLRTSSDKSFTAAISPSGVLNLTFRSSSRRTQSSVRSGNSSAITGIERIAQAVSDEIEADEQSDEKERWNEHHPGRRLHF